MSALAKGGTLADRLHSAGIYLIQLQPDHHFSDSGELRERLARVMAALTDLAPEEVPGEGTIAASTRALSEADATRVAGEIVSLFLDVALRDPWHFYHERGA